MNKNVVLISFYNPKQIGVKYLEAALKKSGYNPTIIAIKKYNSKHLNDITAKEINLLKELIRKINPIFVGFSVMSSFNLETVKKVQQAVKECGFLTIWGGVLVTLIPKKAFENGADYVISGEGEEAIVQFADSIASGNSPDNLPNIIYYKENKLIKNELLPLKETADEYGLPEACNNNRILIDNNRIIYKDQNLNSYGYEISATRGCPFSCSYCSSVNLRRLYTGQKYVKFRSVENLMSELNDAKKHIKKLRFIHFWDEIFPDDKSWIDEFTSRYKNGIGLPFEIWGHPLKIKEYTIMKLVEAGLFEITVGIQSGSEYIRRDIFNRYETEQQILKASKILQSCGVPNIVYDFMLRHPFETLEDLKKSYELCMKLYPPFSLQLHGLGFLPGTDICQIAIDKKIYSEEELNGIMFGNSDTIYKNFWGNINNNEEINFWYNLIYLTQFNGYRNKTKLYSSDFEKYKILVTNNVKAASKIEKFNYYLKKSKIYFSMIKQ
ncbi:MAG: hypothetical protein A2Y17_03260 [Clostridiales bacterium GWF2_38_85]|nr:MAG: hypothetical protein A2Y17_03260 [Clostridiales bacterium GWF2_38_85]HBL85226.1 hypothetical protein [Clostridiales bacterium]